MTLPRGPLLLDGAMGTALQARGLARDEPPDRWVLERPEEVARVHAAHAAAGARIVLTCTFSCASARVPVADADTICLAAVALARQGAPGALVAGALGPGDPGAPAEAAASPRVAHAAAALAAAGADLLWLETFWRADEARAALAAALSTGLPVVVTCVGREADGRLSGFDGAPLEPILADLAAAGAAAVGVNCVFAGPELAALAGWAAGALAVPLVLKPSPGLPGQVLAPAAFAAAVRPAAWAARGRLQGPWLGGCCGATAGHLAALAPLLQAGPDARG